MSISAFRRHELDYRLERNPQKALEQLTTQMGDLAKVIEVTAFLKFPKVPSQALGIESAADQEELPTEVEDFPSHPVVRGVDNFGRLFLGVKVELLDSKRRPVDTVIQIFFKKGQLKDGTRAWSHRILVRGKSGHVLPSQFKTRWHGQLNDLLRGKTIHAERAALCPTVRYMRLFNWSIR